MTKARDLANSAAAFASVSATELGYVDGVTSAIQTQMDAKAPSSTAATLTGTQTLTNKTIDTASNTITGAVTLTGTQTLTNKTLTSPALTTPTISTATTNGDILYGTGSGAIARLGIGTTGQVLNVASGLPAWATASAGGMTLITTTTWDNTVGTYTYSSLGSYKHLLFVGMGLSHNQSAASSEWRMRFNSDTSSIYGNSQNILNGTVNSGACNNGQAGFLVLSTPAGSMMHANSTETYFLGHTKIEIPDYGSSSYKSAYWAGGSTQDGTSCFTMGRGTWGSTAAITSVTIYMVTGNFRSGTMRVYGVS